MAFALPLLKPKAIDVSDLPLFDFQKFFNKEEIGKGGFGAVFTADYYPHGNGNSPEKVVVKKALGEDLEDKKNFVKEARILRDLQHPNIVNFKGICTTPVALILEYAYFDFMPFGMNSKVSSLSGFLATLNDYDCAGFDDPRIFLGICKDIATGLQYLHHKNVAHRDLKPANVLVSNQHYCQLSKEEIGKVWIECPMVCKLVDFGESRSSEVQTKSILNSQTLRVNRGTPVYQAPEFLVGKTRLSVATIEDMKRADVWALGMSLFVLLNPSVKYPYHKEIERAMDKGKTCLQRLEAILADKKLPIQPLKYQHKHATDWYNIHRIYMECIQFSPENRPKIDQVVQMINQVPSESSMDIHLKVSQASSLEAFDCNVAKIAANDANFPQLSHPDNDGSNACAFLSVQIADKIHCLHQDQKGRNSGVWQCICDVAERVITESTRLINPHKKVEEFYDAQSAYKLIKNIGVPIDEYEFSEEFVTGDYVFSWKGRENLMRALSSKPSEGNFSVGLYTCHTVIFTIGFINECFFIVDTHPIPEVIGGKGKGMLKVFPYETDRKAACEGMCQWIWQRLVLSGAKNDSLQSLAFMTKLSRYTICNVFSTLVEEVFS